MTAHPYKGRSVANTHEWLTPPDLVAALGAFDLDPCSPANPPWPIAARHIALPEDGLQADWKGRVWLNPPYGRHTAVWLEKMAAHGNGIALVFARTETVMFDRSVWPAADALLFLTGRPHFYRADGSRSETNCGGPMVLAAYGAANADALDRSNIPGWFVTGYARIGAGAAA